MKKIILLFIFFLCAKSFAQTNGITYQAVILNPNGVKTSDLNNSNLPLASKDICMQFKFIDEFSNIEYQEVIRTKTDSYGMVNLIIGTGTQTSGYATSFDKISWDSLDKSLVVGINVSGDCSSFTEISKQPFNYVPFAYSAINAVNVTGVVAIENGGTNATTVLGAKTNLGLENVDNTTDLNKPISDASKLALDLKEASANKSTNIITDGNSDIKFPSVKSVKTYVDASLFSNSTALAIEVTRATTAENGIAANLVTETNRATTAETTLTTNLATEITRATTAEATKEAAANKSTDGTFATNSDVKFPTEKATKTYVDASASSSSTALATEVTRATIAENGIAANLVTETNRATLAEGINATAITTETTRATSAETTLSTNLATEITRAITVEATKEATANKSTDGTFATNSDVKFPTEKATKTYVDASASSNSTALATEITRATTAENTIAANLVTETNRATLAEGINATAITTETNRATTAENTITANLVTETNRATLAEGVNATAITTETTRATTAETTLATNLATEITRATTAEATKEAAANKSTDGTFATNSDVKFPTEKATKTYVDASASSSSTALATEVTRATIAENGIAANLVTETNRATLAEGINATAITTETNRATTAENTITANLVTETNRATTAETTLATNLTTEITRATTAEATKEAAANKSTDGTFVANSDVKFPTEKATKTYVDAIASSSSTALATEITRATTAENTIAANLVIETNRATTAETTLTTNLATEITRATTAESTKEATANKSTDGTFATNSDVKFPTEKATKTYVDASASSSSTALATEITRATTAENTIATNLVTETNRATLAEGINATAITTETTRATTAETTLTTNLATEITRATTAEATKEATANKSTDGTFATNSDVKFPTEKATKTYVDASASSNSTALATEVTRATTAENAIAANLVTETNRATLAEGVNATAITTETTRATTTETTLAANLVAETNRATIAETTLATNLATEITRATTAEATKEAAANKSTDGTFATNSDVKFPTEKATKTYVDASASSNSIALATEITRATTAENTIATNLVAETNRATLAEGVNATAITTETTRATIAETTLTTNLATEITRATTAEATKEASANKSTDGTFATNSDVKFPTEKATKTYVDASASSNSTALTIEVTRATTAENTIAANLVTETNRATLAEGINATAITTETNRATTAETTLATNLAASITLSQTLLDLKAPLDSPAFTGTVSGVTAVMVGLGDVDNTSDVNKPVSVATQTALDAKASNTDLDLKAPLESPTFTGTVSGVTAVMVGLGDVDNISDVNKPVSAATQTALDTKASNADLDLKAPLESPTFTGTVSGVTAVMVGLGNLDNTSDVNKPVSAATQTALDTKASNADLDLKAPLESPTFTGTVSGVTALMVGLGDVDNTSDVNKPVSAATQTALDTKASNADLDLKAPLESPTFTGAPLAPTATAGISTTQIATTEFVTDAIATVSANTSTNFVDLTTNQTIAGTKIFSSDATINGVTIGRGKFNENSNTAIGLGALESNAGYANTGIGRGALALNDNGNGNTALGYIALSNNVSGGNNVSIGGSTLLNNISGSQNTAIGNNADVGSDGITNSVAIGANAIVTTSNTIQLGSDGSGSFSAITDVKTSGNLTAAGYKIPSGTASQYLMADGTVSTGAVPVREIADEFTATAAVINFTLSQTPSTNSKVKMYVNGIRISNSAYSWTGTTLTYIPANNGSYTLSVNDRIQFDYFY